MPQYATWSSAADHVRATRRPAGVRGGGSCCWSPSAARTRTPRPPARRPPAGHYLGLSKTTLARWAQGKERGAEIVTTVPGQQPRGSAVVPFVGLAEGLV